MLTVDRIGIQHDSTKPSFLEHRGLLSNNNQDFKGTFIICLGVTDFWVVLFNPSFLTCDELPGFRTAPLHKAKKTTDGSSTNVHIHVYVSLYSHIC